MKPQDLKAAMEAAWQRGGSASHVLKCRWAVAPLDGRIYTVCRTAEQERLTLRRECQIKRR